MTNIKFKNTFENMDNMPNLKNCNLCTHQPVCVAFGLFKQTIEPHILDPNSGLQAENLARFCRLYEEKGLR
jgi:hypothetical protein